MNNSSVMTSFCSVWYPAFSHSQVLSLDGSVAANSENVGITIIPSFWCHYLFLLTSLTHQLAIMACKHGYENARLPLSYEMLLYYHSDHVNIKLVSADINDFYRQIKIIHLIKSKSLYTLFSYMYILDKAVAWWFERT
jgi:hypothetical protein